jgi:hypothetical protein
MLGVDDRSGRAAATHADIELVFVAVVTHLGKASSKAKSLDFSCARLQRPGSFGWAQGCAETHCCRARRDPAVLWLGGWTEPGADLR